MSASVQTVDSPHRANRGATFHRRRYGRFTTRTLESDGEGPVVIALHGFADGAEGWKRTADHMASLGRRLVAVDMPGFAQGPPLHQGPVLAQLGRFTLEVVEHYARDHKVVLMGHSLGGCVALRVAERLDNQLAGVVGVGCAGVNMSGAFPVMAFPGVIQTLTLLPMILPRRALEAGMALSYPLIGYAKPWRLELEEFKAFIRQTPGRQRVSTYMRIGRRMYPELLDPYHPEKITIPTLLVWGDKDRLSLPSSARTLNERIPHSELQMVPRCGHHPQVEEVDDFVSRLCQFLDSSL